MILREKDRERLLTIFSMLSIPVEVWAYGSRVKGTAHSGSDLDLVIRSQNLKRIPSDIFSQLKETIHDSTIPILIDIKDWATIPESFHKNILQQYEVFFKNI
ncbi:MAG: nucleotidyltransferase domain-containing protein [Bacteroidia bacterium]|nr:nucleotidyltransferase domain-containing protein [Bacteroidia bacterium]